MSLQIYISHSYWIYILSLLNKVPRVPQVPKCLSTRVPKCPSSLQVLKCPVLLSAQAYKCPSSAQVPQVFRCQNFQMPLVPEHPSVLWVPKCLWSAFEFPPSALRVLKYSLSDQRLPLSVREPSECSPSEKGQQHYWKWTP